MIKRSTCWGAALAAMIVSGAGSADAQSAGSQGWYGRADLGALIEGRVETEPAVSSAGDIGAESNWMAAAGVGYAFDNGLRLEAETAWRSNDFEGFSDGACPPGSACIAVVRDYAGAVEAWSAMANLYFDFNRGGAIQPFIGAGAGLAWLDAELTAQPGASRMFGDKDSAFAWQIIAGASARLSDEVAIEAAFRHFVTAEVDLNGLAAGGLDAEYEHQAVSFGVRRSF